MYLNKLTGQLPPVTPNCPLCVRRQNTSDGFGSGVTVQPMRAGYGALLSLSCNYSPCGCWRPCESHMDAAMG